MHREPTAGAPEGPGKLARTERRRPGFTAAVSEAELPGPDLRVGQSLSPPAPNSEQIWAWPSC